MSYKIEPIEVLSERVIDPRPKSQKKQTEQQYAWWEAQDDKTLMSQVLSTAAYLKRTNTTRIRQASIFARLYSGKPLSNFLASNSTLDASNQLPIGRPTANICYSCTDTLVSLLSQDKPLPTLLSEGGHWKQRKISEQANQFIAGEFFRLKAYQRVPKQTRDALVLGTGFQKIYPDYIEGKVCADRILETELLTDFNDGYYDAPTQLLHQKLVDRGRALNAFTGKEKEVMAAVNGNVDTTPRSTETISDRFITVEAWHLPSNKLAKDGRHVIVCSGGVLLDEVWAKPRFPFTRISYNSNMVGYFAQGLIEILMPTQMEIYRNLIVASQAIELVGVPRIYIDRMSKILQTSFNNRIGTIIEGTGATPPQFLNAPSNAPEIYEWIRWLIDNAYNMSGISSMAAQAKKSPGLNSGEAIREANDLQSARFANFESNVEENGYNDLAYLILDAAQDIVKKTGKYTTVYPGKDGTQEVDFKRLNLLEDTYVIQSYDESSLPKEPTGRQAKLSEMLADGEISHEEFRSLSNFPDLKQSDQLANALRSRILYCLDDIVENGDKNWVKIAPDPFMLDPTDLATTLTVNYINLYATCKLEDWKMDLLRNWFTQVQTLKQQANPPMPAGMPPAAAPGAQPLSVVPPAPSVSSTSNVAA